MRKTWAVIKREYLFRVRKKSFVILTILGPLLILGVYALPVLFMRLSSGTQKLAAVDLSAQILEEFRQDLAREKKLIVGPDAPPEAARPGESPPSFSVRKNRFVLSDETKPGESLDEARRRLNGELASEAYDAYLIIGPALDAKGNILYGSRTSSGVPDEVRGALTRASVAARAHNQGLGLTPDQVDKLTERPDVRPIRVNKRGQETSEGAGQQGVVIGLVFGMIFIYYLTFLLWGSTIVQGVIEEKGTRVIEVVLSSVGPAQYLIGKVTGIGLVALTQFGIWGGCALAVTVWGAVLNPDLTGLLGAVDPTLFVWWAILFLFGYALYSLMFAAVGSMCNNIQEAQQAAMPITLCVVIGFFAVISAMETPDSTFAVATSLFPLTAPLVMLMRLGIGDPPLWQVGLSFLIMAAAGCGIAWVAARIFRIGTLMYGKRPTIPEVVRWIRAA